MTASSTEDVCRDEGWQRGQRMSSVGWFFFLIIFLKMWTAFKIFIEFVTTSFLFYVRVFWLRGMWGLSSPTRDRTHPPPHHLHWKAKS